MTRVEAVLAITLPISAAACGVNDAAHATTSTPMPELVAATNTNLEELHRSVISHDAAVDSAPDLSPVGELEDGHHAVALESHAAMHHAWEDMALCIHEGEPPELEDEGVALDGLEEELEHHFDAMTGLSDLTAMHDEEARHQSAMSRVMDALSTEQAELGDHDDGFTCLHMTDDDMHDDMMRGH